MKVEETGRSTAEAAHASDSKKKGLLPTTLATSRTKMEGTHL